ncbi:hypothetical protein GF380_05745 [Candidatus Uhrbacteria bacterium]|nr:hypothetical protein [Candidatus Uhrbacteria bacterium]
MNPKKAMMLFLVTVFAIAIPLTLLLRARIDLDRRQPKNDPIPLEQVQQEDPSEVRIPSKEPDIPDPLPRTPVIYPGEGLILDPDTPVSDQPRPEPAPDLHPVRTAQEECERAGGHWNECGSPCRNLPPGSACIEVCVAQCECGGFAGFRCPEDQVCTDYEPEGAADAMGVCRERAS